MVPGIWENNPALLTPRIANSLRHRTASTALQPARLEQQQSPGKGCMPCKEQPVATIQRCPYRGSAVAWLPVPGEAFWKPFHPLPPALCLLRSSA